MELDALKDQLNARMEAMDAPRSTASLAQMLQQETYSVLRKIRRSLVFECWFTIFFMVCAAVALFGSTPWSVNIVLAAFLLIGLVFLVVFFQLIRRIDRQQPDRAIAGNIHSLLSILRAFTRRYFQFSLLLTPVCFFFGYWLSFNDPDAVTTAFRWDVFVIMLGFLALAMAGMFLLSRWYIRKLYGQYVEQLERLAEEMNQS